MEAPANFWTALIIVNWEENVFFYTMLNNQVSSQTIGCGLNGRKTSQNNKPVNKIWNYYVEDCRFSEKKD